MDTCPTYELTLPEPEAPAARRHILQALAPTLLLDGIWLARVAQPATGHLAAESQLFGLYCRMTGLHDPARSPALRFRASLTLAGAHLPDLDNPNFFADARFPDFALNLPALHLCLMHRPRTFFPELLGYTLAHVHRAPAWWDAPPVAETDASRAEFRALALAALDSYPQRESHAGRIRAGWSLYRQGWENLLAELAAQSTRPASAEEAMAAVVRSKLPQAIGYHRRVKLAGRGLDDWLREGESAGDFRPLLQALRESSRIDRACPAASRLVKAMEFGGSMFGVFDDEERRACLAWIEEETSSFPRSAWECSRERSAFRNVPSEADPAIPTRLTRDAERPWLHSHAERGNDGDSCSRELYPALLRAESPAEFPPAADAFVGRILRRARWLDRLRPWRRFAYTPAAFHDYIEDLHRRAVARYRPPADPPKVSRELCRWAALQLSPAILVDGAWLAGVPTVAEKLGDMGRHLLKIYADELGNGRTDWNHPNVQRRLLDSLGVELPPFDSGEFAAHPGFVGAAFDIPVYLMAIGQRPDKYFPEILGLNLAIELSGLGAEYMSVVDILDYHGIDSTIIKLHLSIDNLASGHAVRAREAVALYLDGVLRREGGSAVAAQWRRIWVGYLSLSVASLGLAWQLLKRHVLGK